MTTTPVTLDLLATLRTATASSGRELSRAAEFTLQMTSMTGVTTLRDLAFPQALHAHTAGPVFLS
ncbi:hypothetical protein XH86_08800 [Bradyrhizobium guangdongense]|uniref:Uncharacterized protein n=1 Tax=Bradyrhizobium guangdongense TaxID=1325090 RepID=A0ABX6UCV5_9BRAD|nr:hypothetical protein X265_08800 [Bradyrhizobium guangdongense]QOZ58821.1 hypothetical protein XH86_08800 [Bradyrhizobium guangdongense]